MRDKVLDVMELEGRGSEIWYKERLGTLFDKDHISSQVSSRARIRHKQISRA